jgi:hypothetical protein
MCVSFERLLNLRTVRCKPHKVFILAWGHPRSGCKADSLRRQPSHFLKGRGLSLSSDSRMAVWDRSSPVRGPHGAGASPVSPGRSRDPHKSSRLLLAGALLWRIGTVIWNGSPKPTPLVRPN